MPLFVLQNSDNVYALQFNTSCHIKIQVKSDLGVILADILHYLLLKMPGYLKMGHYQFYYPTYSSIICHPTISLAAT